MKKLIILLLLAGCSGPVITDAVIQKDVPVAVPDAQPIDVDFVQWQVLTVSQLQALIVKLQSAQQQNTVIFALDTQNYNNLSLNFVEIQRYIQEQKAILALLKQIIAERAGQPPQTSAAPTGPAKNGK